MSKIVVTGGCGYIGSHTIVDLIQNGYEVVCIDNLVRGKRSQLDCITAITGVDVPFYEVDMCDESALSKAFDAIGAIGGVIHFAALKSVPESVEKPEWYLNNNMGALQNLLQQMQLRQINHLVFSSSCAVYGRPAKLPVTEDCPFADQVSPYALSKQKGELLVEEQMRKNQNLRCSILRYFNPIGAHPSGKMGENPYEKTTNLLPLILKVAKQEIPFLTVNGNDYPTPDGTAVRDYVHVCDIAHAHVLAFKALSDSTKPQLQTYNLGSEQGYSVLEMIHAFEACNGRKVPYSIHKRRVGDPAAIYADISKAKKELNWLPVNDLGIMLGSAWQWARKK
jgi:UDP-glucose 4-epimerase